MIERFGVTPGPWEHSDGMGYIFANRVGGVQMKVQRMTVCNTRGWGCLQYHGEDKARAEMNANEKLIATAPDMFEDGVHNANIARKMYECRFEPDKLDILFRQIKTQSYVKAVDRPWSEIREEV